MIRTNPCPPEALATAGRELAADHRDRSTPGSSHALVTRLRQNERQLRRCHALVTEALLEQRAVTPAAEWLVDNFHVVQAQLDAIEATRPGPCFRRLPSLSTGPLAGYPRIHAIAWAVLARADSGLEAAPLDTFLRAYQHEQPLTIAELWALPTALRLVLIENLRRAATGIVRHRDDRAAADRFATAVLANDRGADRALRHRDRDHAPLPMAFAAQLVMRLRDHDPRSTPALAWLDRRLAAAGTDADRIVADEHLHQGATNVTVRNIITSMRWMEAVDWAEVVESQSAVDAALGVGSGFAAMDFASRDRYRHAIEDLARGSRCSELEVAGAALRIAAATPIGTHDAAALARRRDPGHHLLGAGRREFERTLGYRPPLRSRLPRWRITAGIHGHLILVGALVALLTTIPIAGWVLADAPPWLIVWLAALAIAPAAELALAVVHRCITRQLGPVTLPGLELTGGVPAELRTLIAVPTMLVSHAGIRDQVARLEVHYLASPGDDLVLALLTDWTDALEASRADDAELLATARTAIALLNERHGPAPSGARFLLLHRRRIWNAGENRWIGWERKRGKLHELNRWLRGATDTTFLVDAPELTRPPAAVRYVLTLDADTRLPRGAARALVGKMAHPLQRPSLDAHSGRVHEGHGVLQPRIAAAMPSEQGSSWFQRLFSGPTGIDAYAAAVSDVYQDLLGEGSYTGKGIYDVDAFAAAQADRVPDSTVLSHDLLEGIFARAGLASEVELVDDFPVRYDAAAARQHRWARGDWQLLPWILGRGRDGSGHAGRATIPLAGRWKMLDNLRRSLVAPCSVALLLSSAWLGTGAALVSSGFVLATLALPFLLAFLWPFGRRLGERDAFHHLLAWLAATRGGLLRCAWTATMLGHQALLMADAIATTLVRLFVRRRRLLEWLTSAAAERAGTLGVAGFYGRMQASVAVAAGALLLTIGASGAPVLWPWLLLWSVAPWVAERGSRRRRRLVVDAAGATALRQLARRTWAWFEQMVGDEDHALPPDNLQLSPQPVTAQRTSPTNIGLYLLSVTAAHDFAWLTTTDGADRLDATLRTVDRLERHRGHLFNWYDTRTLQPLPPKYVSTVDSGNLAGHLLATAAAVRDWPQQPLLHPAWRTGIDDAVQLALATLRAEPDVAAAEAPRVVQLTSTLQAMATALLRTAATPAAIAAELMDLRWLADAASALLPRPAAAEGELSRWVAAARTAIRARLATMTELLPLAVRQARNSAAEPPADAAAEAFAAAPVPTLAELPGYCARARQLLGEAAAEPELVAALDRAAALGLELQQRLLDLQQRLQAHSAAMQFGFLFDQHRCLFSIGYRVAEDTLDDSHYDLLASESRLASFLAIAKGDIPGKHWARLGRGAVAVAGGTALVSWSGSMFEYLMPKLVLHEPEGSLLAASNHSMLRRQIRHGRRLGIPWGISESAYNARDLDLTYQYSSFGVPGLGQKRGLAADTVVAPYATALAAMVMPSAAVANLQRIGAAGGNGAFGCYEALDYTAARRPPGTAVAVVQAFMAHHQGMTLCAIDNVLHAGILRDRFHSLPLVRATELLLQERVPPRQVLTLTPDAHPVRPWSSNPAAPAPMRIFHGPHDPIPRTNLLSNGNYTVVLTAAGGGGSRWRAQAIGRWREDATTDLHGNWIYLRDARSGAVWSVAHLPTGVEAASYEVAFPEGRAEIARRDGSIASCLHVVVSPEHDAEVRRVSLSNLGLQTRELEATSYTELVLGPAAADAAHPVFARMFVQTEYVAELGLLLATRRRRDPTDAEVWVAHQAVVEGEPVGSLQFETDRERFLGRGGSVRAPRAVMDGRPLAGGSGTVLDAIFSLRLRVRIAPGKTARIAFWTLVASSRAEVLALAAIHRDPNAFERAATMAWTRAQALLLHLGIAADEALLFQRLANRVLYSDPSLRPPDALLRAGCHGPSALWAQGISGDLPLVVVRIDDQGDLGLVRQLLRAHEYWRSKRLAVDLVLLNERASSYVQDLHTAMETLVRSSEQRTRNSPPDQTGRIFVLRVDRIAPATRSTLLAAARVVLFGHRGSLAEQVRRRAETPLPPTARRLPFAARTAPSTSPRRPPPAVEFWNGLGGFTAGGREYTIALPTDRGTPAPWINVITNGSFGFQVAAEGAGYTWSGNSRENQLTAWSNDPTVDPIGETMLLRDLDTGEVFGPTAAPVRLAGADYTAHHGQGYTRFVLDSPALRVELVQFVPLEDPIKLSHLRLHNRSDRTRRLSLSLYVEWVLGSRREQAAHHIVTDHDHDSGVLLAHNPWREEFRHRVAFVDLGQRDGEWTCDRTEFLGRNGTLDRAAGMHDRRPLLSRCGGGLDPCAVLRTELELAPGASIEFVCSLGEANDRPAAIALALRYRTIAAAAVLRAVIAHWDALLGTVQVETPDRAFDLLVNRWLLYQTVACRLWARAAFYQAGGAFGFRDQLQDHMALVLVRPALARQHLLRAAAVQYEAGDVMHWWLPQSGRGVRTRISDDALWLVFATAHYLDGTGETAVLDEQVPFVTGPELAPDATDAFLPGDPTSTTATLFEHCARALDRSLQFGAHGLPHIGTGDWNDGFNRVGQQGRGESVWLAWFLHRNLTDFAPLAAARGETARAAAWLTAAATLAQAIDQHGWDGAYYRRGYYDDGSPLGSSTSVACRIDSLAQSWAVLSGAGDPARRRPAMTAMYEQLVRAPRQLVLLFTPPFDTDGADPGYVRAYPPGLRENGGQYTHAAAWAVMAFARLGDGDRAGELFSMLNPIRHSLHPAEVQRYRVEPYVVSADIYSVAPHEGRGGWTWYTGSAAWLHRAAIESLLGLRRRGAVLLLEPCVPSGWRRFRIDYRIDTTRYRIVVDNPDGKCTGITQLSLDGATLAVEPAAIPVLADGQLHQVQAQIG
ncbi:MAG: glycosyl transferase [Planctomycetes bacterium]|jgi:cyclic beta-1,2-glucan synthetase|nr:glycosyl transferase [Planctomycetota bacterium]